MFVLGVMALLLKHLLLPLVWCAFVYRVGAWRAAWWMVAALAIFATTLIPYLPDGAPRIVTRVLLYTSTPGYGFGSPLLFAVAIVSLPLVARWLRLDVIDALIFTALGQLVFAHGAGWTHSYLVLGLGAIRPTRWLIPLTLAVTVMYWTWAIPGAHNLMWWAVLPWFVYLGIKKRAYLFTTIPVQRRGD